MGRHLSEASDVGAVCEGPKFDSSENGKDALATVHGINGALIDKLFNEHGACLSHLLTVGDVHRDDGAGARLEFSDVQELVPKVPHGDIRAEIEAGRLSEQMQYCGQEGFNITLIPESDISRILDLTTPTDTDSTSTAPHPDESLRSIAGEHFEDS
jgi:hypothetical protein